MLSPESLCLYDQHDKVDHLSPISLKGCVSLCYSIFLYDQVETPTMVSLRGVYHYQWWSWHWVGLPPIGLPLGGGGELKWHSLMWAIGMLPPKLMPILGARFFLFFFISYSIGLCVKTAFGNNFGPREVPKLKNLHIHFLAFSGWGTSRCPKLFPKAVFTPSLIEFLILKKKIGAPKICISFGAFRLKKWRLKKWIF